MAHWLFKSEPSAWSYEKVAGLGAAGTDWSGVRNHTAKLNMQAMKVGEQAFFYHSNEGKAVVGIVKVSKPYRPDPSDARQVRHGRHPRGEAAEASRDARRGQGRTSARQDGPRRLLAPFGAAGHRRGVGDRVQD